MRTWINQVHTRLQAIHHSTNRDVGTAANSDHSPVTVLPTSEVLELAAGMVSVLMFIYVHAWCLYMCMLVVCVCYFFVWLCLCSFLSWQMCTLTHMHTGDLVQWYSGPRKTLPERLRMFYYYLNPAKIQNVDVFIKTHRGSEDMVNVALMNKYAIDLRSPEKIIMRTGHLSTKWVNLLSCSCMWLACGFRLAPSWHISGRRRLLTFFRLIVPQSMHSECIKEVCVCVAGWVNFLFSALSRSVWADIWHTSIYTHTIFLLLFSKQVPGLTQAYLGREEALSAMLQERYGVGLEIVSLSAVWRRVPVLHIPVIGPLITHLHARTRHFK